MTTEQRTFLIYSLFNSKVKGIETSLDSLISQFGISDSDKELAKQKVLEDYNLGVHHLNPRQFDNLINIAKVKILDENEILNKLKFYEVDVEYHNHIVNFLKGYNQSNKQIEVAKMDSNFKGVQVATNDHFNDILNLGYTGDWVIDPKNVKPLRIQIASMNETGSYTRGYYMNADIDKMEPIEYEGKIRYRIFIKNPRVVNSGNRNIKFSNNPVRYIK
jgi:hypothetical protein